jgi:hypothetical protein
VHPPPSTRSSSHVSRQVLELPEYVLDTVLVIVDESAIPGYPIMSFCHL